VARRNKSREVEDEFAEAIDSTSRPAWQDALMLIGGLALLIVGAKLLIDGALAIAAYFKVSEVIIGLTVVAIGTSLPELATSVVAALKKDRMWRWGMPSARHPEHSVCSGIHGHNPAHLRRRNKTARFKRDAGICRVALWLLRLRSVLNRAGAAVLLVGYLAYIYSLLP
jgi:cation:H+ antiporter